MDHKTNKSQRLFTFLEFDKINQGYLGDNCTFEQYKVGERLCFHNWLCCCSPVNVKKIIIVLNQSCCSSIQRRNLINPKKEMIKIQPSKVTRPLYPTFIHQNFYLFQIKKISVLISICGSRGCEILFPAVISIWRNAWKLALGSPRVIDKCKLYQSSEHKCCTRSHPDVYGLKLICIHHS